jgi:hypothetical protein
LLSSQFSKFITYTCSNPCRTTSIEGISKEGVAFGLFIHDAFFNARKEEEEREKRKMRELYAE